MKITFELAIPDDALLSEVGALVASVRYIFKGIFPEGKLKVQCTPTIPPGTTPSVGQTKPDLELGQAICSSLLS